MFGWSRKLFAPIASLALASWSMSAEAATPVVDPAILRLSQRNEPADLDPATATLPDEFFIIRALSEGLLIPDPAGGEPQPGAAERWEVSEDGLVYTFHLRAGAKWSNGDPLTAADFVASYRRLLSPETATPKADLFFAVKNAEDFVTGKTRDFSAVGFQAPDPNTLVITLERPMSRFPLYAASGPWIPVNPRVVAQFGRRWTRPDNFVGNGPFMLAEWRPHQRIIVRKNPSYREASQIRLDEIHFIAIDNGDAEERTYRAGQIDVTMDVPKTKIAVYARERPAELHQTPLAETRYLSFNTRRPPLDNRRVRLALSLAIDRKKITDRVTLGGQEPAYLLLPPLLRESGATPEIPPAALGGTDDQARALLAAEGFPGGKGFPHLILTGWAQSQSPVLEAVQERWRQTLGIEVSLVIREAKVHVTALRSGDYDIGFITLIPDVADAAAALGNFVTDAPGNYPHWSNDDYDGRLSLVNRGGSNRVHLLKEAVQLMDENTPLAPLYFNTKNWLMSPRVHGWREDALWQRDYRYVYLDNP